MMESNHMMESHHMALLIAEIHLCYSKLQNCGIASYDGNPSYDELHHHIMEGHHMKESHHMALLIAKIHLSNSKL